MLADLEDIELYGDDTYLDDLGGFDFNEHNDPFEFWIKGTNFMIVRG